MLKRLGISLLIMILISSVLLPHRTQALAPAIPYVAVGSVATGVAAVAVIVDVLGFEGTSDEIDALSQLIWAKANASVKQSLYASYDAAVAAGDTMMTLSSDVIDFYRGHIATISSLFHTSTATTTTFGNHTVTQKFNGTTKKSKSHTLRPATGYEYITTYEGITALSSYVQVLDNIEGSGYNLGGMLNAMELYINDRWRNTLPSMFNFSDPTPQTVMSVFIASFNINVVPKGTWAAMEAQKNALAASVPVAIPVPMAKDFIVVGADAPTVPLDLQPDNTWINKETGKVYNPADVQVKAYPKVKVQTDAKTGTKIGTITQDGVDVNIRTGEKVATGEVDVPNTGILEKISTSLTNFFDLSKPIDWSPMRNIPNTVTTSFPFSLPWDVKRAVDALTVTGTRPDFTVTMRVNGQNIQRQLPFAEYMDDFVPLIRSGILLIFTFGLIFATRKLLGGAR